MGSGRVLFRTRPHAIVLLAYVVLALAFQLALRSVSPYMPRALVAFGSVLALGVLAVDYFFTIYEASTETIIKRQGVPWVREEVIPLTEIQDFNFRTGILGRTLGFGTLEIESAGTEGKIVLDFLPTWAYRRLRPLRRSRRRRRP